MPEQIKTLLQKEGGNMAGGTGSTYEEGESKDSETQDHARTGFAQSTQYTTKETEDEYYKKFTHSGERKETRSWHYINLPNEEQDVSKAICPKNGCIFDAFYSQIKILKDTKTSFLKKQEALMFVGHFVGDIHQPMHAGYPHDLGGNLHRLKFSNGNKTNMHKMWDGQIIEHMELVIGSDRFEEVIQEKIHTFLSIDHSSKIENWAQESRDIAMSQSVGYRDNVLEIATDEYMESHFDIVQNRIALAAIRLSKTLNSIYKTNH